MTGKKTAATEKRLLTFLRKVVAGKLAAADFDSSDEPMAAVTAAAGSYLYRVSKGLWGCYASRDGETAQEQEWTAVFVLSVTKGPSRAPSNFYVSCSEALGEAGLVEIPDNARAVAYEIVPPDLPVNIRRAMHRQRGPRTVVVPYMLKVSFRRGCDPDSWC